MEKEETRYYLIKERSVGKEKGDNYFIYREGEWQPDTKRIIIDRLMGYAPDEPADSPYGIGSTSIMDEIEEISYEKAMEYIEGNI